MPQFIFCVEEAEQKSPPLWFFLAFRKQEAVCHTAEEEGEGKKDMLVGEVTRFPERKKEK